ncbi:MAG: hypothetical protein NWF05_02895 [Candidatus Bathyarchaeota archaeon]|nr:hypothetical protein [Candidatus Bathyarchaeota archaeon]
MRRKNFAAVICVCALLCAAFQSLQGAELTRANPGPATQIPPIVEVTDVQVDALISWVNGTLWAEVDSEFLFGTVYGLGDQFQTRNSGIGLLNGQDEVTVTVVYDRLDAQFPVPLNSTDISVKRDSEEEDWAVTNRVNHLFAANLPELHWTISPVPNNFSITTHYEYPVSPTCELYAYLGTYSCLFPLSSRFGLQEVSRYSGNERRWLGTSTCNQFNIEMNPLFSNLQVYLINGFGTLTPLNYTIATENPQVIQFDVYANPYPHGVVMVFDETPLTTPQLSPSTSSAQATPTPPSRINQNLQAMILPFVSVLLVLAFVTSLYKRRLGHHQNE